MGTSDPAPAPSPGVAAVAALFDSVADVYGTVGPPWFGPIAEGLVEVARPAHGERVLDIGTGRGAALWPLAAAVGAAGRVRAIDIAPAMVAATAAEAVRRGLGHVEVAIGDGDRLDEPDGAYDLVTSSLVLFFLPDPATALRTWWNVLRPGGRLAVSTFAAQDPTWRHVDDVFVPYLPAHLLDARTAGARGPFASDEGVEGLLADAGFSDMTTAHRTVTLRFADMTQWREWSMSHGQRGLWRCVPQDERAAVVAEATVRMSPARTPDGHYAVDQVVRYTVGRVRRQP